MQVVPYVPTKVEEVEGTAEALVKGAQQDVDPPELLQAMRSD